MLVMPAKTQISRMNEAKSRSSAAKCTANNKTIWRQYQQQVKPSKIAKIAKGENEVNEVNESEEYWRRRQRVPVATELTVTLIQTRSCVCIWCRIGDEQRIQMRILELPGDEGRFQRFKG